MDEQSVDRWCDEHDIRWVRTLATSHDGLVIGKHLSRGKFQRSLPLGHAVTEVVLAHDIAGTPYLTWWDEWRRDALGDYHLRPDLSTLVVAPDRPHTADVLCDFVDPDGRPLPVCPRSVLTRIVEQLQARDLEVRAAFEIEAMLFTDRVVDARRRHFRGLTPVGHPAALGYVQYSSRQHLEYIDVVLERLDALGIGVEGWHDEAAPGQFEINLEPTCAIAACDDAIRVRQVLREVALEQGHCVTFMAKPTADYGNGLHVHHSLTRHGESLFYTPCSEEPSPDARHWIGGLMATMPAATSILCPTVNAYRRMVPWAGAPTVASWAEDNKLVALRLLSQTPKAARVEHRVPSGDGNPYLVLATVLAGGLAGLTDEIEPPPPLAVAGWGLPAGWPHLPTTITKAADALEADTALAAELGADFTTYWVNTRRWEWMMFHTTGGDPTADAVTDWELDRYFELA